MMLLLLLGWQQTIKVWVGLHAAVSAQHDLQTSYCHSMTVWCLKVMLY